MAQDLSVNIKTTSDVPQAMDKAKSAVVSFAKQTEDIQKKFSTAFKDIFLGFTAPMVLLQGAISYISSQIENAKREAKEGLDLIATGESKLATTEQAKMAAFFKRKQALEEERKLVEAGQTELTKQILTNPEFKDFDPGEAIKRRLQAGESIESVSKDKDLQRRAMEYFQTTEEGKKAMEEALPSEQQKPGTFKGPEGFGSVIGVGANPVMEKMTRQNELLEEIRDLTFQQMNLNNGGNVADPFTERVPLTLQKMGAV